MIRLAVLSLALVIASVGPVLGFDSALSTQPSALVSWDVLENGLCELGLDRDGDGVADGTELHVVAWSSRSALSDGALDELAGRDHVWLFLVEEDDGTFVYAVHISPLFVCEERCERSNR
ncbi:hypothetical protein [Candidatus Nitrospira bockiana]